MKFNVVSKNKKKSGIYAIINRVNNKIYIGKTKNFYQRYHQYLYGIKSKKTKHVNSYLLNSILKHKSENFRFEIIEILNLNKINSFNEKELYWMDYYNTCCRLKGYNLRRDSSSGMIVHKETSLKISNRLKKEWSDGLRSNHSNKLKINWSNNIERKKEQSKIFSKMITKYNYVVSKNNNIIKCDYSKLVEMKLKNCVSTFFKKKTNRINFKGYIIERIKLKI
jgi:group I intron endonuclease